MYKDYMFKQRTTPMATYKKGSKPWLSQHKAKRQAFISKLKEWCVALFIVFICSVDLEPLLDMLLR